MKLCDCAIAARSKRKPIKKTPLPELQSSTSMPITLDPTLRRELAKRIRYYNELGIYDFYRRDSDPAAGIQPEERESMAQGASAVEEDLIENASSRPESTAADSSQPLNIVRDHLGDCTSSVLHNKGGNQIVFGMGIHRADLIFIG